MDVPNPRVSIEAAKDRISCSYGIPPMVSQHGSCPEKGRLSPHVYFRDLNKAGPKAFSSFAFFLYYLSHVTSLNYTSQTKPFLYISMKGETLKVYNA